MLALDNDVLIKLAAFELLVPAVEVMQAKFGVLSVLPTARFVVGRKTDLRGQAQIAAVWPQFTTLSAEPDMTVYERLLPLPQIDEGEALLLASLGATVDLNMVTGDKRCLRALAASPDLADVLASLSGRVLAFEQVILALLASAHASTTCENLCRLPVIDRTVHAVTGGTAKTIAELQAGFISYVNELRSVGIPLHPGF